MYDVTNYGGQLKQTRNHFNALTRNDNSVFYGNDRITKTLINKAEKSDYLKDKVLLGFYWKLKDENELYFDEKKSRKQLALLICLLWNNGNTSIAYNHGQNVWDKL